MLQDKTLEKIQSLDPPDIMLVDKNTLKKRYEELIQYLQKDPECDHVELYYAMIDKIKSMAEQSKKAQKAQMYTANKVPFLRVADEYGNPVITNIPEDIAHWVVFVSYYRAQIEHNK